MLRLAAQRLLRHKRVGAGRTGVHFVGDEMVQFEEVDMAHGDFLSERFPGSAIVKDAFSCLLATFRQIRLGEHLEDFILRRAIKDR